MAEKKIVGPDDFKWVRSIYGKGPDAKERYEYISDGGMNTVIREWHEQQEERKKDVASPSSVLTCPRVLWFKKQGIKPINEMTWAVKQRMLLGRTFEDKFAEQLGDKLLYHWKDNPEDEPEKFTMGEGMTLNTGVPDYLLKLDKVVISDAKTSRSDSFGYVPIHEQELWQEWNYYKYKIQLTNYFMLAEQNPEWFKKHNLPMPEECHLFIYALDDGVVRREVTWKPTSEDRATVLKATVRFNTAVNSDVMPPCTCRQSFGEFDVKFCDYGEREQGKKIAESCCSPDLINRKEN